MQNAHLRLGRLSYQRNTEKVHTLTSVHVSHYIGESEQAHLLSFFGNDAEVGAITAAIQERHHFELHLPDGSKQRIGFGEDASCYKSNLSVPQHKKLVRHVVAVSSWLHNNGSAGRIFLIDGKAEAEGAAWSTLVNLLGLPADPRWGEVLLRELREEGKMLPLAGVGCSPTVIHATRNEMLERVGRAVAENRIPFPEKSGPITWPQFDIAALLSVDRANSQTVELT
jgi:hypothetical protein